jgi:hypothetical protein
LFGWKLLLLEGFRPLRHGAVAVPVGDGLAQMFSEVPGNRQERTPHRRLTLERLLRLISISMAESTGGRALAGLRACLILIQE